MTHSTRVTIFRRVSQPPCNSPAATRPETTPFRLRVDPNVASTNEHGDSSPMPGHQAIPAVGPFVSLSPTQPMSRASTPTDDDGTADRCAHNGCTQQIWAVCVPPQCQRPLCAVHFGPCRMAPPYAPSRCHERGESTALCPCADCAWLRTPSLPLAPGRQSQRILTSDELAVVQANRERALILRQLKQRSLGTHRRRLSPRSRCVVSLVTEQQLWL